MNYDALAKALMKEALSHVEELTKVIVRAVIEERNRPRPIGKLPPPSQAKKELVKEGRPK